MLAVGWIAVSRRSICSPTCTCHDDGKNGKRVAADFPQRLRADFHLDLPEGGPKKAPTAPPTRSARSLNHWQARIHTGGGQTSKKASRIAGPPHIASNHSLHRSFPPFHYISSLSGCLNALNRSPLVPNRRESGADLIAAMVPGLVIFKVKQFSRKKEQINGFYFQIKNILTTFPQHII